MAGIYSQGGSAGYRYAGWLSEVEAKNFQFGGKVFNGSPSAIYVGSNLVWWYWLKPATRQAIMDAFLDDGWAVINATNAYLNQLAASDRDKATALAGFINETPTIAPWICGYYEPSEAYPVKSKTRLRTGVTSKNTSKMKAIAYYIHPSSATYTGFCQAGNWAVANGCAIQAYNGSLQIIRNTSISTATWGAEKSNKSHTAMMTQSSITVSSNGSQEASFSIGAWYGSEMQAGSGNANGIGFLWQCYQVYDGNTEVGRYFAIDDRYAWDYIGENIIDMNPT